MNDLEKRTEIQKKMLRLFSKYDMEIDEIFTFLGWSRGKIKKIRDEFKKEKKLL